MKRFHIDVTGERYNNVGQKSKHFLFRTRPDLELCATGDDPATVVAQGVPDGWVDFHSHGVWDYVASILICFEADVATTEHLDRELLVTQYEQ